MSTQSKRNSLPPIVPMTDETRAMLDYATSEEGRAKIENALREIQDGKGIEVTPDYIAGLNERITKRVAQTRKA